MRELIGQIIGIFAVIIFFVSYQTKDSKKLLFLQTAGTTALVIHYFFIGATSGFALNVVCIIRNVVYYNKNKAFLSNKFIPYLLALLVGVMGAFSWQGPISLIIIAALMINTVCLSSSNTQFLRKSVVLTCSMLVIYNVCVKSYGGILNESISVISSLIGIYRYRKNTPR